MTTTPVTTATLDQTDAPLVAVTIVLGDEAALDPTETRVFVTLHPQVADPAAIPAQPEDEPTWEDAEWQ